MPRIASNATIIFLLIRKNFCRIQHAFQCVQRVLHRITLTPCRSEEYGLLECMEVGDLTDLHFPDLLSELDQESALVLYARASHGPEKFFHVRLQGTDHPVKFRQTLAQIGGTDRLQKIVHTVHPECADRILVKRRCEYNRTAHRHSVEDRKAESVRQLDVQEQQVCTIAPEPGHGTGHGIERGHHADRRIDLTEEIPKTAGGKWFIFNDQNVHVIQPEGVGVRQ